MREPSHIWWERKLGPTEKTLPKWECIWDFFIQSHEARNSLPHMRKKKKQIDTKFQHFSPSGLKNKQDLIVSLRVNFKIKHKNEDMIKSKIP